MSDLNCKIIPMKRIKIPHLGSTFIISIFCIILFLLPFPYSDSLNDLFLDLQFKIRGDRILSDKFLFVFVGEDDIRYLSGWPITRDYYGYLTYVLNQESVQVIGLDILFDRPSLHFTEYDEFLADIFKGAGNVCLPMIFSEISQVNRTGPSTMGNRTDFYEGIGPILPFEKIKNEIAGLGFSNLGRASVIRKVPLVVTSNDSLYFSFGLELAKLFFGTKIEIKLQKNSLILDQPDKPKLKIPLAEKGQLRLNHFGRLENVQHIGILDLLQQFDNSPDSLDLAGKLVVVGVILAGETNLKATPFDPAIPASLIQLTVAENIINQTFLREIPAVFHLLAIILLAFTASLIWKISDSRLIQLFTILVMLFWLILVQYLFNQLNWVVYIFYPTLAFLCTHLNGYRIHKRKQHSMDKSLMHLLEQQIKNKESELYTANVQLEQTQQELLKSTSFSEQLQQMVTDRQQIILQLENELSDLKSYIIPPEKVDLPEYPDIIYSQKSKLHDVLSLISRIKSDDIPVLLSGETGTGKEKIARAIHFTSHRQNKPFIAVNCGALTETLLESELFGHEKGSFTGASNRRLGRFELANGGTIFLDEISETTQGFQLKILRVLQEGNFERVGGENTIHVDVRIIAATNRNLSQEMEMGKFRSDLFYRLNGFPVEIPRLRERVEDIPALIKHFLEKYGYNNITGVSEQVILTLKHYSWPGNIRELENAVRRAAILALSENRNLIQIKDLPPEILNKPQDNIYGQDYIPLEQQILESLRIQKFSRSAISQTAEKLGNRDRGTITEYLRGIMFETLVTSGFDYDSTAKKIANSEEREIIERVQKKLNNYINNLYPLPDILNLEDSEIFTLSQFKGLPKKYHPYLKQILVKLKSKTHI
jgi:transcriptional regulator with GAF, ATPase, and Fis domain/CHASE2 domain-containing sensor protein